MDRNCKRTLQLLKKCIITTSIPSLGFYEKVLSNSKVDALLIYNCLYEKNVQTIPAAHGYEIIIDFNNEDIYNIIVKILNRLLKFDCDLYVKILELPGVERKDVQLCMKLLTKLSSKKFIRLDIQNDGTHRVIKDLLEYPIDNVTCFIGPGNTGKTSIIASVSELFCEQNQRIALLDFTKNHKLKEYFHYSIDISLDYDKVKELSSYEDNIQYNSPCLYTYDTSTKDRWSQIAYLCEVIKYLSEAYDYVLINGSEDMVGDFASMFKVFPRIFIVHDCMLNKIHSTHKMLLDLQKYGIDTHKAVSIIYNKVVKKSLDIGSIEEKLIFKRDDKGHLIPMIDIKCMTLEIFHKKSVAMALNDRIMTKSNVLNRASLNYIVNIKRLYNAINNLSDFEYSDLQLSEFFRNHVYDVLHNFFAIKADNALQYSKKLNNFYKFIKVKLEKWFELGKEITNRYFKNKSVI
ncbi:MAG: hypothetical protein MJA82_21800 [Clostridia bacterium]|nr:hypothetical protein [Clostridia bacterium]